jgi:uncharacterized protein with FMN-binding domain
VQDSFAEPAAYQDGIYYGSAEGFGGTIQVEVTISGGQIQNIRIISAAYETASYLRSAQTVISSILNAGTPNVDAVSGATYSSTGILNAVKRALSQASTNPEDDSEREDDGQEDETGGDDGESNDALEPSPDTSVMPEEPLLDGVYIGSGEGFGGEILVQVTVTGGRIEAIEVISAQEETPLYFHRASAVIAAILGGQTAEVDAVSGATYSSEGIMDAVRDALRQAAPNQGDVSADDPGIDTPTTNAPDGDNTETGVSGGNVPNEDTSDKTLPGDDAPGEDDSETDTPSTSAYQDGLYTATGWCEDEDGTFRYELTVTVTVSDGKISAIAVEKTQDESEEPEDNDRYLSFALDGRTRKGVFYVGVPQQIIQNQSAETVDAVSGATYSSETIQRAVLQALEGSKVSLPDEGDEDDPNRETTSSGEPSQEPETETDPFVSDPPDVETRETKYLEDERDLSEQPASSDEPEKGKQDEAE